MDDKTLSRKQSTRMQLSKDNSIMGDHVDIDKIKSTDTSGLGPALTVPDVYIHKRGGTALDHRSGLNGQKLIHSVVMIHQNDILKL